MVTMYTAGNPVEITYSNGDTMVFQCIAAFRYRPGLLIFIWDDDTMKIVTNPGQSYHNIVCPEHFDVVIE